VNRGVLVIILAVIAVFGYEFYHYYADKPYVNAVKPLMTQYLNIKAKYTVLSPEYRDIDKVMPKTEYDKLTNNCQAELQSLFVPNSVQPKKLSKNIVYSASYNSYKNSRFWYTKYDYILHNILESMKKNNKFFISSNVYAKFDVEFVDTTTKQKQSGSSTASDPKGQKNVPTFKFVNSDGKWYIASISAL